MCVCENVYSIWTYINNVFCYWNLGDVTISNLSPPKTRYVAKGDKPSSIAVSLFIKMIADYLFRCKFYIKPTNESVQKKA